MEEKKLMSDLAVTVITDIEFLRQVSKKTSKAEVDKRNIVPLIKYALHKGWIFGYGLAAVQVGIPIKAGWYWLPTDKEMHYGSLGEGHLLINPEIIEKSEPMIHPGEGCLSIPHRTYTTRRYNRITLINDGQKCVAEGLEAQILQHEIDHMNGILVMDREYKKNPVGRNDACPCGSGKKYKKCCIDKESK